MNRPTVAQLQHATMVATCGSFSEAARRCNVSQPTISNSVSDLEELLGKQLFRRSTRRVETTSFGDQILPVISEALTAVERVVVEAKVHINPSKQLLRVAFTPLLEITQVDALCSAYRLNNPNVEIVFKECTHESLEQRLLSEQIDIVFAHDVPSRKHLRRCGLFLETLHYVPPNGTEESTSSTVPLGNIADAPLLLTDGSCGLAPTTLKLFEREGLEPRLYAGRAMTHAGLKDWAELGLGGAILPSSKLGRSPFQFPKVEAGGEVQKLEFQAVWMKSSEATTHLNSFYRQIPKVAHALLDDYKIHG